MRVAYSSDWHLGAFPEPPAADFDVLVCAGDLCEVGEPERAIQSVVEYAGGKSVVAVAGNHDLYTSNPEDKRTNNDFIRLMRAEARRQDDAADDDIVHVLTADEPVCWIGNVRFVGLTLWSDWMLAGRWTPNPKLMPGEVWAAHARAIAGHWRSGLEEYRRIRTERGIWTPYDAVAEHARERAILMDELASPHDGPTVVVTHHPPMPELVDAYQGMIGMPWWAPAFYGSDVLRAMPDQLRPDLWICGHVHVPCDIQYGRTRVVSNPVRGGKFNPYAVVEV